MCRCVAVFILSQCWSSKFTLWFACDNVLPLGRLVQTAAFFRPQCDEQRNMPNKIIVLPIACSNFVSVAENVHKQEKCFERMSFSSKIYAVGFPWPCHIGTCLVPILVLWTHAPKHGLRRHWLESRFLDCVNVRGTQVDQTKMSVFYNKQTPLISVSTTCLFVRSALRLWNLLQTSHLRWSKKIVFVVSNPTWSVFQGIYHATRNVNATKNVMIESWIFLGGVDA